MINKIKKIFNNAIKKIENINGKINNLNKYKATNIILVAIYVFIGIIGIAHHEAWRDEAQAWMIAKNLSFSELFKVLRVEGHPILWFLVLRLFAKAGLSYYYISYISLIFCTIGLILLLTKCNFDFIIKIAIMISSMFSFYNPVVARSYCLCVFIGSWIAVLYKDKYKHSLLYMILIALLLQTHIKMCGLVFGLVIDYWWGLKRDKKLIYILIPFFSLLLLIAELYPYGNYLGYSSLTFHNLLYIDRYISSLVDVFTASTLESLKILIIPVIVLFIMFIHPIRIKNIINVFMDNVVILGGLGCFFLISLLAYHSHPHMLSIVVVIYVVSYVAINNKEISNKQKTIGKIILIIVCITSSIMPFKMYVYDYDNCYSNSLKCVDYITNNVEEDATILVPYGPYNVAVMPYVNSSRSDITFYDIKNECVYQYHKWPHYNLWTVDSEETEINDYLNNNTLNGNTYVLSNIAINNKKLKLVYSDADSINCSEEYYYLYRVNQ